ncbi:hypothetical protein EDB92DRAFT_1772019, partial [Lactarius akahatsu]
QGNAAFKAGDYPAAIGHYTAATIADPSDPTYFLNRAAAYLKLSKYEDAERDCSTVLNLSNNKNVKAFFRRAQARVSLQKLGEAHNGAWLTCLLSDLHLQWALKIEPNNDAVKAELVRRAAPLDVTTPPPVSSTSSAADPPKRRRVPITIVDSDAPANTEPTNDLLSPISSRLLSTSLDPKSAAAKPEPASFKEAKQVRDEKNVGRVGGGIFRVSGNDTVFKTRE